MQSALSDGCSDNYTPRERERSRPDYIPERERGKEERQRKWEEREGVRWKGEIPNRHRRKKLTNCRYLILALLELDRDASFGL